MIAVAPTATEHRADVAVYGLDLAERDLDVAVGQDAVEVPTQELGDLVEAGNRCQRSARTQAARKPRRLLSNSSPVAES